jgi:hypothetical protein
MLNLNEISVSKEPAFVKEIVLAFASVFAILNFML